MLVPFCITGAGMSIVPRLFLFLLPFLGVTACAGALQPYPEPPPTRLSVTPSQRVPPPLAGQAPTQAAEPAADTYSITVSNAPVRSLLQALARDAGRELDIDPAVKGRVSLNAVGQPLDLILERIAAQAPIRITRHRDQLLVRPDEPYSDSYKVDYVNVHRSTEATVTVATQIAVAGGGDAGGDTGNRSQMRLRTGSSADFWTDLKTALGHIVGEAGGKDQPAVMVNALAGLVTVRTRYRQHRRIGRLLRQLQQRLRRQVLIEASILEVELGDRHQAGVDWQRLLANGETGAGAALSGAALRTPPYVLLNYAGRGFSGAIRMLQSFGKVRVLSSPKIMALNNQTALLKVVDEKVYFTIDRQETRNSDGDVTAVNYRSAIHTIPVGLIMSVTPQIAEQGLVTMSIRPTISRVTGYVADPAPRLQGGEDYDNLIPELQVRELESVLQVQSGNLVMLGGLMQTRGDEHRDGVPGLAGMPLLGRLFSFRDDRRVKTELVIMLRPRVVEADKPQARLPEDGGWGHEQQ